MSVSAGDFLNKHKKFRVDSKKLAVAFIVFAVIVAIVVFWWLKLVGITITGEAFCGMDEHIHSSECYGCQPTCGYTVKTQTDALYEELRTDTDALGHLHSDECYGKAPECILIQHVHTADCFPDKTADVETVSDWLDTIRDVEITNNVSENLIRLAMSQMDYEESTKNFEYDEAGNKNGYTRYGEWYGNPYGNWNTMFVSFCLHYSNINNSAELKSAGAQAMMLAWQQKKAFSTADEHTAQRGDVVFIDSDGDKDADSVAIVSTVSKDKLTAIMGDSNNRVEFVDLTPSDNIIGYGCTGELHFAKDMEYQKESAEQTTAPAGTSTLSVSAKSATTGYSPPLVRAVLSSLELQTVS